ncbi:MAG: HAD-IA family hydrolase [Desulfobacterales bacterium]|nr:HAD-IA family hydrolase [Desulfobacterales bacterium]
MKTKPFSTKAILFDFDGTLTKPYALDFPAIKQAIGCPVDMAILEFIKTLPSPEQQKQAFETLECFEMQAAENSEPNTGAEDLIRYLRSKNLYIGIITRNTLKALERAIKNFENTNLSDFDLVISRDDPVAPKPSPDSILLAAKKFNVDVSQIIMVGDYIFDIRAGNEAGAVSVFLDNDSALPPPHPSPIKGEGMLIVKSPVKKEGMLTATCNYKISHLEYLRDIVRMGIPLSAGKFPNDMLKLVLDEFPFIDPSVLISPGVGEDTAAINIANEEVLVLKSDPITFATDSIGQYAVLVNANDIATSGAKPRWFLTTLLFPCGITASEIFQIMLNLREICQEWGITLCGGHTEITDAVTRPVIIGMLAGTVLKSGLIDKRNMQTRDMVLLTKGIAVEGTSIIAREFEEKLKELGMEDPEIEKSKEFLSNISILKEARIAAKSEGTSAMHDITEGGVATALEELSIAGRHKIRINMDKIHVFPETKKICRLLNIDPLGLIGSGSLLICCRKEYCEKLISDINEAGINVSVIGEILGEGEGIEAVKMDSLAEWPRFEVDEITRLF